MLLNEDVWPSRYFSFFELNSFLTAPELVTSPLTNFRDYKGENRR